MILVQIHAVAHGEHMERIRNRRGEVRRPRLDDVVLLKKGMTDDVHLLLHIGVPELVPGVEVKDVAGFKGQQFIPEFFHPAVVQGEFDSRAKAELGVPAGVGVHARHPDFGAAGSRVVVGVGKGRALGQMKGNDLLVVQQFGEAGTLLDGFSHFIQVAFRTA